MMAVAALLVWRKKGSLTVAAFPLGLFALQLVLNLIWSPLFFGLKNPGAAMVDLVFLWIALGATIIVFWRISLPAGLLLLPYLLWVSFAGVLNFTIWRMNS
jgi:tryptophan-rich sensory protein